ncbi:unnamed protein product [Effrenium voratum]|uniref:Calcineurin-like phosphoesterase domain-containing protein n=1 Tax=Effrenium voratum TaxID=2562239 RepID=A0AA36ICN9_9DINO|nr:unnamed protein product [Effrenium voratum]CAJ1445825.1 unnamed protein product [Effrenium voratum]
MLAALLCLPLALAVEPGTGDFEPWLRQLWEKPRTQALDLRVAKGLGAKGYEKARVSVVAPKLLSFPDFNFTYRKQFRYRWTDNYLHSSLIDLQPGKNTLTIAGQSIQVDLPAETEGIRAVFWSDPCFSSKWIHCAYADKFQTFPRSIAMLNAIYADPSMDMFAILGDNFYDQTGELAKTIFDQLSPDVKRRFLFVVNGNHDNWVCGSPGCGDMADNFGIGQMQYYTSDPVASNMWLQNDEDFMDFSIDPEVRKDYKTWQNVGTNFLVYHKLGNIGFLGFSGAALFSDMLPYFSEACDYFEREQPAVVFLLGHWNSKGMGCGTGMSVPAVRKELLALTSCSTLGNRLKYMDGHEHCNYVQDNKTEPVGFMIGAHGMDDSACEAQYGFLYLDSTDARVRLYYFEVQSESGGDKYDDLLKCVSTGGLSACTSMAQKWLDVPAEPGTSPVVRSNVQWV